MRDKSLHFLKRSAARTLSVRAVARLSEAEAVALFRKLRWADTDGAPVCPHCGHARIYEIKTRRILKCAACRKQFTETSGTIFHSAKLEVRDLLLVIATFVNAVKGVSALQIARDAGISYKSAFVLLHKLREAVDEARSSVRLGGLVELDGAYYGGSQRAGNVGRDGQRPENRRRKRCVLTLVERGGPTATVVVASENTKDILAAVRARALPGATLIADEHAAYDALHAGWQVHRINHRFMWADEDAGVSTNQAESFHSRMRRAVIGQYHRIAGRYLHRYAAEMAWRSDRRRTDNGQMLAELAEMAACHPVSRNWKGYWQARA